MSLQSVAQVVSDDTSWLVLNSIDKAARVVQNGVGLVVVLLGASTVTRGGRIVDLPRVALGAGAIRGVIGGLKFPRDVGWLIDRDEHGHRVFFKHHNHDGVPDYNKGTLGKQIPLFVCHSIAFWAFFGSKIPLMKTISSHCRLVGLSAQFFEQVKRMYETHHWYDSEDKVPPELRPNKGAGNRLGTGLDLAFAFSEVTLDHFAPEWLAPIFGVASGGYWLIKVWAPKCRGT